MKKSLLNAMLGLTGILLTSGFGAKAQCPSGYSSAALNWDFHYFKTLPASGTNYMFGVNSVQLGWSSSTTINGVNGTHTGSAGSFGSGNDMQYTVGNGTITMTFVNEVQNLKFSVYDIDNGQNLTVTASNAAGTSQKVTMAKVSGSSLTITGSGTTTALAKSSSSDVSNSSTNAVANVTITAAVKKIILSFTKSYGSDAIWLSDLAACVNGDWPTNYHAISTPDAGQPAYVLAAYTNNINVVNTTNNTSSPLYTDSALTFINSLAYDPYKQIIYYTDQTPVATNVAIYKYDVSTNTKTTLIADVRTLGIQLFTNGVGSGAASFYNGSLFLGIDQDGVLNSPVAIWRIDFDGAGNAIRASRFWGANSGGTGNILYDWADFVINDGVVYNYNAGYSAVAKTNLQHFNLNSETVTASYTLTGLSQASVTAGGKILNMTNGGYAVYNGAGAFGAVTAYTGSTGTVYDAGEAFKYPLAGFKSNEETSARKSLPAEEKSVAKIKINIYPNPTTDGIWIEGGDQAADNVSTQTVEIYNIAGEIVYSEKMENNLLKIDLTDYANGIYMVKVGDYVQKIVKE